MYVAVSYRMSYFSCGFFSKSLIFMIAQFLVQVDRFGPSSNSIPSQIKVNKLYEELDKAFLLKDKFHFMLYFYFMKLLCPTAKVFRNRLKYFIICECRSISPRLFELIIGFLTKCSLIWASIHFIPCFYSFFTSTKWWSHCACPITFRQVISSNLKTGNSNKGLNLPTMYMCTPAL